MILIEKFNNEIVPLCKVKQYCFSGGHINTKKFESLEESKGNNGKL